MTHEIPRIAVVIPNFNDSRYLGCCLKALFDQPVLPDEIVIVDDASTDDSVDLIRQLIAGQENARLIECSVNGGTYKAFEIAMSGVSSDYVLPLAANDFVLPGIFAVAKKMLGQHPAAGIWSAMAMLVDEENRMLGLHPSPLIARVPRYLEPSDCVRTAHRLGSWFASPTMIYRKDALASAGGFNPRYGGLSDLFVALVLAARHGALFAPEVYGAIRMHPGSFLAKTLRNAGALDSLLDDLVADGAVRAPELFNHSFSKRFTERVFFAAIRSTGGSIQNTVPKRGESLRSSGLQKLSNLIPTSWAGMRTALAFLLLRPYDLLPTIWYRYFGAWRVKSRSHLSE